jgi:riboflavin kinase / FMN adenylyltransferase
VKIVSLEELMSESFTSKKLGMTIGNFDGVHLGHQQLLSQIKEDCRVNDSELLVITFIPHPMKILRAKREFLIHSYKNRRLLLENNGVDYLLELDFTRDFSNIGPKEFLDDYVFNIKRLESIYLGYDFSFGANKKGDRELVIEECKKKSVRIEIQAEFKESNELVSSSVIRQKIENGNVHRASEFLGRPFTISGTVVKGAGRGRQIGFPTANITFFEDKKIPKRGVYITQTKFKDLHYYSVTNIGHNPTFTDSCTINVETFLLDFDNDIYGETIEIGFIKHLRDEKKFLSVNELVKQIGEDVLLARDHFKK